MKRLSHLEIAELLTIRSREPNRFVTPRWTHLEKRGLIRWVDAEPRLTQEGEAALRRAGG